MYRRAAGPSDYRDVRSQPASDLHRRDRPDAGASCDPPDRHQAIAWRPTGQRRALLKMARGGAVLEEPATEPMTVPVPQELEARFPWLQALRSPGRDPAPGRRSARAGAARARSRARPASPACRSPDAGSAGVSGELPSSVAASGQSFTCGKLGRTRGPSCVELDGRHVVGDEIVALGVQRRGDRGLAPPVLAEERHGASHHGPRRWRARSGSHAGGGAARARGPEATDEAGAPRLRAPDR